jgi:ParB/RepB/Spo0J family partition protein
MLLPSRELPLDQIRTDETCREPDKELLDSLRKYGLFEPILVRRERDDAYEMIDGGKRFTGARTLGWPSIVALVQPADLPGVPRDLQTILVNTQRRNLGQLYVARHASRLIDQEAFTQTEIARELHLSKGTLSSMLAVLRCKDLVAAIELEGLQFGAARRLAALSSRARAELLAKLREIQAQSARFPSVRQVEEMVRISQGKSALRPITADDLTLLAWECEERGIPVVTQAAHGKQTCLRVVLTVTEDDEAWVQAVLTPPDTAAPPASTPAS